MTNFKLKPIQTEKSLNQAKDGQYTFKVDISLDKSAIKRLLKEAFGVDCVKVKTISYKKTVSKNYRGVKKTGKAYKKALVMLKEGQKIDLFEKKGK